MRNNISKDKTKTGYSFQMFSPASDQADNQKCVKVLERKSSPALPGSIRRTYLRVLQVSLHPFSDCWVWPLRTVSCSGGSCL